jgi:hypothetical protein
MELTIIFKSLFIAMVLQSIFTILLNCQICNNSILSIDHLANKKTKILSQISNIFKQFKGDFNGLKPLDVWSGHVIE